MEREADQDREPTQLPTTRETDELGEDALEKVAGGMMGGDEDLEDLEVERRTRR